MTLVDELYMKMLEVGYAARRNAIAAPLAPTMIDIAHESLDMWRQDERAAWRYASKVVSSGAIIDASVSMGQLPEPTRSACWRLIGLLGFMASLDDVTRDKQAQDLDGQTA